MLPVSFVFFLIGGIGPNILIALLSMAVLFVGSILLWRPGESPILLFAFALPWAQASIAIWHANWLGIGIVDYTPFVGDTQAAVIMSLAGLLALAVGMRLGAGKRRWEDVLGLHQTALSQPPMRWFRLYAIAWVVSFLALSFAWIVPGLSQPMLALAAMKWAFFYMLAFACFTRGLERGQLFVLVFLFELVTAIGGYFSDFKTVFFVTLLAALASGVRVSPKTLLSLALLVTSLIVMGIVWTAVKDDYRIYVGGGRQQIVTVDYLTRLGKLAELVGDLSGEKLANGADQFLRRISYVEFFGVVLVQVPTVQPHTEGAILWDSLIRPFMPRLLFPEKEVIDDTARTNLYTGGMVGTSEGTSISLGYVAEAYIDFGKFGMFGVLCAIGIFYGAVYRTLLRWRASQGLLGTAMATMVLESVGALENSFTKVFGGVIVSLFVAWAMILFILPHWAPWLVRVKR
jgi:hypothetical protein